ncbi:substrate-binding domain-containing protein [Pseudobutyrivibrio xylanivorans]|uniref:D-xylose transport system substrate-binding protein n=1 Tax=Pseudobutyrivibrio xylanivorans DSM 14809 TaxID=1123012 RepID=A0A1M6G981_PSEXY|nr:substrate-binding domain-containing protein [Pseudobutyrivibrio xylanivorans]SHJ06468.1 D-xylose transport system substrate-binding protein [Pseudobutyrivibrio xylanivorans DSM 14809]
MKGFLKKMTVCLLAGCLLCGCSSRAQENSTAQPEEDELEIGMCFDSFVIERWEKDRDIFVDTASSMGATVNVQNANGDVEKQIEQIQYLIDKKVDCIVIIAIDAEALTGVVKDAKKAGIPVVCYDRLIPNVNADLYISFDNEKVGSMLGSAIVSSGAKKVIMICGPYTDMNVPMVNQGFIKLMNANSIDILDTYNCEGWKAELGGAYVYDHMDLVRTADAIMCGNDDVAASVIKALAVAQLAGEIPVVGQDADLPACQHIVQGTQLMTVYKPVGKLAEEAAKLSVQLAQGQDLSVMNSISDGENTIPYVAIEPVAVNKDNLDEVIIDGGFHSREDVYLNTLDSENSQ